MAQIATQTLEAAYREKFPGSAKLYERGSNTFPNGVTHDGRFMKPFPVYVDHAVGAKKYDIDGNEIIDYWMGHGSLLCRSRSLGPRIPVRATKQRSNGANG
jgi:glutamate-1-semialdehyde 2,1-aminomutase